MESTQLERDIDAECRMGLIEQRLMGLAFLLTSYGDTSMCPRTEEIQGVGSLVSGLADEIKEVNRCTLFFRNAYPLQDSVVAKVMPEGN